MVSSTSVRATCPVISSRCVLLLAPPPECRPEPDWINSLKFGRDNCKAGEMPNRIPVNIATNTENSKTGMLTWIAASCGNE